MPTPTVNISRVGNRIKYNADYTGSGPETSYDAADILSYRVDPTSNVYVLITIRTAHGPKLFRVGWANLKISGVACSSGADAITKLDVLFPVQTVLVGSKTGVSGAALASTALTLSTGVTLATHTPVFAIIKFASGTLGIAVIRVKTTVGYISGLTALLGLTTGDDNYILQLSGLVSNTGNLSVEVTTASAGASTFDIFIYGTPKP